MQHVIVEQEFSAFYARRLTLKMGLHGRLIQSVSAVIEKMYWLFQQKDLDLIEINPLGINSSGEVMALDGKITVNGGALGRHADLSLLAAKRVKSVYLGKTPVSSQRGGKEASGDRRTSTTSPLSSSAYTLLSASHFVQLEGTIGILCNGAGLTMTTLDLIYQAGGKPANFLNLGGESFYGWNPENFHNRIKQGLTLVTQSQTIQVLLINILGSVISCYEIAQVITTHLKQLPHTPPKLVVRLVGHESDRARDYLSTLNIPLVEQLDEAIVQAVALVKSRTK
jgi:succinyl-CoA synthetase beta subunit